MVEEIRGHAQDFSVRTRVADYRRPIESGMSSAAVLEKFGILQ